MRGTIVGQKVSTIKLERTRELRRDMTPQKRILWERLRANQLHGLRFRRQHVLDGFIVDFYCHAARLIIKIDGPIHEQRQDYDAERDHILQARGLTLLRITNADIETNLPAVLARISAACGDIPS